MILFRVCYLYSLLVVLFILLKLPFLSQEKKAKMLVLLFKISGPTGIKLGQSLAVRIDNIGEVFSRHLALLQDSMPPFSPQAVENILWQSFGKGSSSLFAQFDHTPVAAASVAQVHKAVKKDGTIVAVKILRPKIEKRFVRDIKTFYAIAKTLEKIPRLKRLRPVDSIQEMENWVKEEIDLTLEARNAKILARNFSEDEDIQIPTIDDSLTARRVITMDWVDGMRIDDIKALEKAGLNPDAIVKKSARIFFLQVFRDGFFHADMHPGNMFVSKTGVLMPVDFGIVGRLSKQTRNYVADILYYIAVQDYERAARVHFLAGYVPSTYSLKAFADTIKALDRRHARRKQDWSQVSFGHLLADLFITTYKFNMRTRPELLLLQKTIIVAEGVGRLLAPKENMWLMIRPTMESWMWENRGVMARINNIVSDVVRNFSATASL